MQAGQGKGPLGPNGACREEGGGRQPWQLRTHGSPPEDHRRTSLPPARPSQSPPRDRVASDRPGGNKVYFLKTNLTFSFSPLKRDYSAAVASHAWLASHFQWAVGPGPQRSIPLQCARQADSQAPPRLSRVPSSSPGQLQSSAHRCACDLSPDRAQLPTLPHGFKGLVKHRPQVSRKVQPSIRRQHGP